MATQPPGYPIGAFCSYAREDEPLQQELKKHLSVLQRQGLISFWHDRLIIPGANRAQAIDEHLNSAALILLLVSSDFLASDYCYEIEMRRALERHRIGEACVIPILLRPVDWKGTPIEGLQALPTNATPITRWQNRDEAFADVTAGIRRAIEDLSLQSGSLLHTPLSAIWNVPYSRNPYFLGRKEVLSLIHTQFQEAQTTTLLLRLAISGLGGVGKTQVAIEYAYRYRQEYQAVFWVLADTRETLISSYRVLAELLHLPEYHEQDQQHTIEAVKRWLSTHKRWLLILDNADELRLIPEFLPPVLEGHVLLTTRASAPGKLAKRVEVETFSQEQGALFLLRRAGLLALGTVFNQATANEQILARQISWELDGLPLALDQAGAYLEETGTSLSSYIEIYQTHRTKLLGERRGFMDDHPEPVATTWSLSFARVEQRSSAAADLLRLCAFLAPDAIPEEILTNGASYLGDTLASMASDSFLLNQVFEVVRAYSLLRRNPSARLLTIHRLVQAMICDALSSIEVQTWRLRTILAVSATFPSAEFENWSVCERCLPHALHCVPWIAEEAFATPMVARLLNNVGFYLIAHGRYADADPLIRRALVICEQHLGSEHPDTATSLDNLAYLYVSQGEYILAEPLYEHALAIREQTLSSAHPDTVRSLNYLARLYTHRRKYVQAEVLYKRALSMCEQQLGTTHPTIMALSLNNLALLYMGQGKYTKAEPLYQRALALREQYLSPEHPEMASTLNNLAILYYKQGKFMNAELLYQRALTIRERHLGPEHPYTAISLNNLASLYGEQGKYAEAEPLYRRALEIVRQSLGPEHPDRVGLERNYVIFLEEMQEYEQINQKKQKDHKD